MAQRFRRPIKKSPASDPQQYRLYRMENEAIGARTYMSLTRKDLARFVRAVCREYRIPKVVLKWENLGKWAAEWRSPNIIVLGTKKTSRDLLTIAHEMAHHLHWAIESEKDQQSHGPEFMACYLSILDTARIIPMVGMLPICEHYGLKVIHPGSTLKSLIRAVRGSASNHPAK